MLARREQESLWSYTVKDFFRQLRIFGNVIRARSVDLLSVLIMFILMRH